jgi:hypothetical protein
VLPWTAVVMANDRLPKQGVRFSRFHGHRETGSPKVEGSRQPELPGHVEGTDHTVIDI